MLILSNIMHIRFIIFNCPDFQSSTFSEFGNKKLFKKLLELKNPKIKETEGPQWK